VVRGVELVAPSAGVSEPQLKPLSGIHRLNVDRANARLTSDDGTFCSGLFVRHESAD
jgi:hypothetical protein